MRLLHYLNLVRWNNLVLLIIILTISVKFILKDDLHIDYVLFIFSVLLGSAAGYIINDWYDQSIDLINKPEKTYIGVHINEKNALIVYFTFNIVGTMIGFYINPIIGFIDIGIAFWLWFYSKKLKQNFLIGNLSVAFISTLPLLLLSIISVKNPSFLFLFCIIVFLMTLLREIIKDIEDMRGDLRHGCKTVPILIGIKNTKVLLFFIAFLLVVHLGIPIYLNISINSKIFSFVFIIIISLFSYLLFRANSFNSYKKLSLVSKLIMLIGIIGVLFL